MSILIWIVCFALSWVSINWLEKKFTAIVKAETGKETLSARIHSLVILAAIGLILLVLSAIFFLIKLVTWFV